MICANVGDHLHLGNMFACMCITSHPGKLSLAILQCVGILSTVADGHGHCWREEMASSASQ